MDFTDSNEGHRYESAEVWVPVHGFPVYTVSNHGHVKNFLTGKPLALSRHNKGYLKVNIVNDMGSSNQYVHRLVLKHFVNNPGAKSHSDHIDGNRANNHVSNLRWASAQENAFNRSPVRNKRESLPKGVSRVRKVESENPYKASIRVDGKVTTIGLYATPEEAGEAYRVHSERVQKEFSYSSRPTPSFEIDFMKAV
jgi:hypothetical protein